MLIIYYWHTPLMAQASSLVLFNKKLRILPINVGITNVQNSLGFLPHF